MGLGFLIYTSKKKTERIAFGEIKKKKELQGKK
jgi:hypothetical protein